MNQKRIKLWYRVEALELARERVETLMKECLTEGTLPEEDAADAQLALDSMKPIIDTLFVKLQKTT